MRIAPVCTSFLIPLSAILLAALPIASLAERLRPGRASFLVLSARAPADRHDLFELETKPFEPALAPGDRLGFSLRLREEIGAH